MIRHALLRASLALLVAATPLSAQNTSRTVNYVGPTTFTEGGLQIRVRGTVAMSWPTDRNPNMFGEHWINATLTDLSSDVSDYIVYDGRTYTDDDFDGALRPYFAAIRVTSLSMSLTVSNAQNCSVAFSRSFWSQGETEQKFCRATGEVGVATWSMSRATFSGVEALRSAIYTLERDRVAKEAKEREEARQDSIKRVQEARDDSLRLAEAERRDSLERARTASRDSARLAELDKQDSLRSATADSRERERLRQAARDDSVRRAREEANRETPERRRQREEYERRNVELMTLISRNQQRSCQQAEAAYASGNLVGAIELFRQATEYPHLSPCVALARRRTADANMTLMANGAASLIGSIGRAFGVEAGFMVSTFPIPRDDMAGASAGLTVGKGIYYADLMLGNAIFAPLLSALNNIEPDYSSVGCSGPFGVDYYGNDCEIYYSNPGVESRYRVNGALTLGIVAPKGMDNFYLSGNLSYVMTDDGNLIVPAFGFIWSNTATRHARYGRIYGGGGMRVMFTTHQGELGLQFGVSTTW